MHALLLPDDWQRLAVSELRAGRDVVVDAPTGAGKTLIFELWHPEVRGQALYTVPTRALANDKLREWRGRGWDVGIMTGDLSWNTGARILVATLETQQHRLMAGRGPGALVIDECQMIGDPVRGVHYEIAIATAPATSQLLLLSGSLANPGDLSAWLNRLGRDATTISHRERPVPLDEIPADKLDARIPDSIRGFWPRVIAAALAEGLGPILVFAPRRNAAEKLAATFAAALPSPDVLHLSSEQKELAGPDLAKLLHRRIAYHHSGLPYKIRAGIIEPLAKNGQLNVVVATMGLAAGINFSLRSVLVTETRYVSGGMEREVRPDELLQMFGRAGRRGIDDRGHVIVLPQGGCRLHDGQPRQLRRVPEVAWPAFLTVLRVAADASEPPFPAASRLAIRLFSPRRIPLGVEHCEETGPRPCGLWVDAERARFHRRDVREILNSAGIWDSEGEKVEAPLSELWVRENDRWLPALRCASVFASISFGRLCRIAGGAGGWGYGRESAVFDLGEEVPKPVRALRAAMVRARKWPREKNADLSPDVFAERAILFLEPSSGGGKFAGWVDRGNVRYAQFEYAGLMRPAVRDASGKALADPPERLVRPAVCAGCDQQEWCAGCQIVKSPAHAWRTLGLVDADGTPTRRGVITSFFHHGEGLAVAAALEREDYPMNDLIFDVANLRAGHRFAGEDSPYGGHLGIVCAETYGRADHPGYLEMGVPVQYGNGASQVIRALVEEGRSAREFAGEELRPGDIERALLEWRSFLRHASRAPDYDWDRWRDFKAAAAAWTDRQMLSEPERLPALLAGQMHRKTRLSAE